MPNELLTQAIKEAYASAPSDIIIIDTLEIRHPVFVDDNGNVTALRVVRGYEALTAKLEVDAPVNAGEWVDFQPYAFDFKNPTIDDKSTPHVTIQIDNVSREITKGIEAALYSKEVLQVTYRPFLSDDLSAPHYDPPLHLTLTDIVVDTFKISGKARFGDFENRSFPKDLYTAKRFPGLVR